jgi:hypothetical protein
MIRTARIAAFVALAGLCAACAGGEEIAVAPSLAPTVAPVEQGAATPEFHGAALGEDTLRSRLDVEA